MQIVYVVDTVQSGNGVAASAQRSARALRERGHRVRVVATDGNSRHPHSGWIESAAPDPQDRFVVQPWAIPVVEAFAAPQHFTFAKADRELLERAFDGADVVHIWLATPLGHCALAVAQEMGIPVSAGFHVQPENIAYNVAVGRNQHVLDAIYAQLRDRFYNRVGHVHCPSRFLAGELEAHGYTAQLHVISNGVTADFRPAEPALQTWTGNDERPFRVMTVGRLSPEKQQGLLLRAVSHSRYRDRIEVQIAGRGPGKARLVAQAAVLRLPVHIPYWSQHELIEQLQQADLYVHPAAAEIEAVACLEAVACGLVPVISDSTSSAASQFALDDRSLFRAGDPKDLARKIDWWIEHPAERAEMSPRYAQTAQAYAIDDTVDRFEAMLHAAIEDPCQ